MLSLRLTTLIVAAAAAVAGAAAAQSITVDDFGPGCELTGKWADNRTNGFSGAGTVGNGYHYTSKYPPAVKTGRETATWTARLPAAGRYKVEVSFRAGKNRSGKVTYEVEHSGGKARKVVDQRPGDGCRFETLGVFEFAAGAARVALVSDGGASASADAARFTPDGGAGPGGLDDVLAPGGGGGGAAVRLDEARTGKATYEFGADGTATVRMLLATYGPARLSVRRVGADGGETELFRWKRENDRDPSPLAEGGQPVAESIVESSPGDPTAASVTRRVEGRAGDKLILELEGQFGRGRPYLEVRAP
ncbi:MAG: hypothetical protein HY816_01860 [Candidatus Wallbacteria bacterium]|nr:hypothetical protein [Candidatus Wallbacteria bacterium]